ncbi:unnamed protein product [Plutella xylostella]|uniref:(diamondback moth) hypothetical protein n=1 Tax=Plutella xylostella TaxID=51655 RepID=A0A8S4FFU0_PLUXY|nr:unnamed protein product [Plutella xylostella]
MHLLCSDITGPHIFNMKFLVLLAVCLVAVACGQGADAAGPPPHTIASFFGRHTRNVYESEDGNLAQASGVLSHSLRVTRSGVPAGVLAVMRG